jgi:hypothetical protein
MISLPKLVRMASEGEHARMLDEVVRNGRPLALPIRLRLEEAHTLPVAALGLSLTRVTELTYRPSDVACTLATLLLDRREPDGSFGSIAATAIAAAALLAVADQVDALPGGRASGVYIDPALESRIRAGAESALHALAQAQQSDEESGEGLIGDEIDSAITLWRLGFDTRFARAVCYDALLRAVEDRGLRHSRATASLIEPLGHEPVAVRSVARPRRSPAVAA